MNTSGFINGNKGEEKIEITGIAGATSRIFKLRAGGVKPYLSSN